jgi:uncharacterized protein YndB with AHSA1/START domain
MKDFNWTQFTQRITIQSDLQTIYDAWSKGKELERWFLKKAAFFDQENKPVSKSKNIEASYTYEWGWYAQSHEETGHILEANDRDFVQFTFAGNCIVEIKLSKTNQLVMVQLTQKDIPTDDNAKQNIRLGCASGWAFYLVNLKSVYEGGLDLRNKDTAFSGLINN